MTRKTSGLIMCLLLMSCAPKAIDTQQLMTLAVSIAESHGALNSIWPGYAVRQRTLVLHNGIGQAVRLQQGEPELLQNFALPPSAIDYVRQYPLSNNDFATVVLLRPGQTQGAIRTLFHEDFHSWQAEAFAQPDPSDTNQPDISARLHELKRIELIALADALARNDSAVEDVRNYLAFRAHRESLANPQLNQIERRYERYEGTANYVGNQALAAIQHGTDESAITRTKRFLRSPIASGAPTTHYLRTYSYATGAALAWLLDRHVDAWKPRVSAGIDMIDLLYQHFQVSPRPADSTQYRVSTPRPSTSALNYQDFVDQGDYGIIIESHGGQFKSSHLHQIDANTVLLAPAQQLTLDNAFLRLQATNQWVWIDYANNRLQVRIDRTIDLKQCTELQTPSRWRCDRLEINSRTLKISLSGACITAIDDHYLFASCQESHHEEKKPSK